MSGPETETLTAALRRLADEHASGLLSVATPGRDVVIELAEGRPVAIGPVHDVAERVGADADEPLVATAIVDGLVDRTVAAIVGGGGDWTWDVSSDAERLPVPSGLVDEMARRAVDAAQALAVLYPDDVLEPGHDVETSGELDSVRALFDGERTIEEVAEAAGLGLPTVATMAAALVAAGALATDEDEDEEEPISWSDAVRASEDDEDDDEPELWVMEPAEDESDDEDEAFEDEAFEDEVEPVRASTTPTFSDVAPAAPATATASQAESDTPDMDDVVAEAAPTPVEPAVDEPAAPAEAPAEAPAAAAPAASADGWNDTSWLDELSPQDHGDDQPPVLAAGDEERVDRRAALSSMLNDLQLDDPPPAKTPQPAAEATRDDEAAEDPAEVVERREPKAEPGDVAEFLRELSRLALDDD